MKLPPINLWSLPRQKVIPQKPPDKTTKYRHFSLKTFYNLYKNRSDGIR